MHSHLTFQFISSIVEILRNGFRPGFCTYPIKYAQASLITIPEGQILIQSFSHYLVYLELIEYSLQQQTKINFRVAPTTIFMLLMLKGDTNLHAESENLNSKTTAGTCYLAHNRGDYHSILEAGEHKMFLLTLRPKWFIKNSTDLAAFKPLIEKHLTKVKSVFTLPQCPIDKDIATCIRKIQLHDGENRMELDSMIYHFVNRILYDYNQMFALGRYTTDEAHRQKAKEISVFIQDNFAEKIVEDENQLSIHLGVSIRTLHRLIRVAFGKPLHQQVVDFRMVHSLDLLLTTTKSIHEIAFLVGYNDSDYFSKVFKKHHKVSPATIPRPQV